MMASSAPMMVASTTPDRAGLFQLASEQRGYFTTAQAGEYGYSRSLLAYHAKTGAFQRVYTGVYRFRDYPSTPREELFAAWLAVGKDVAVVSHESALELWELGDLIPDAIHLTVPRSRRHQPRLPGVTIHTTTRPLDRQNVRMLEGIAVTAPLRTIIDATDVTIEPDQIALMVRQATIRGYVNAQALLAEAGRRGPRVTRAIEEAIEAAPSRYRPLE
jgi:predicted transcriptional regulator of viral defense system